MEQRQIKINLGCGDHCPKDWINIDSSRKLWVKSIVGMEENKQKGKITYMDLSKRLKFEDNTVDYSYCSHFIEHLSLTQGKFFLSEVYRVLKPGGIFRIITPDFEKLITNYLENSKTNPAKAAEKFHHDSFYFEIPYTGGFWDWFKLFIQRKNNHHHLYDYAGLEAALHDAGFAEVQAFIFNQSKIPEIFNPIDLAYRHEGALCLEATKY